MKKEEIYNLSNDPARLMSLLLDGHEVICLVDYTLDFGERRVTESDVCVATLDRYGVVRFAARGICYIQFGGQYETRTFEGMCEEENVRFIDPYI